MPSPFGQPTREPLPKAHSHGFSVRSYRKACVDFHWHFHPELELIHIEEGQGVCHAGRTLEPYRAGDLFFLGANLPHSYGSQPSQRTGARWTVLHFLPERWGQEFWSLPQNRRIRRAIEEAGKGFRFSGPDTEPLITLLRRLENPAAGDCELALFLELLDRLSRCKNARPLNSAPIQQNQAIDVRLPKVLAWLEENAGGADLTQSEAARLVGLSPQAFCRFFRQGAGRPFHDYVNELRVARACADLLNSEKSISTTAFDAGFQNLANFNRRFREITGQTPREYRRSHGGVG